MLYIDFVDALQNFFITYCSPNNARVTAVPIVVGNNLLVGTYQCKKREKKIFQTCSYS